MTSKHTFSANDAKWMARAFSLAQAGQFSTTPNPCVGCVIVNSDNHVVGEGAHMRAGTEHAEIHALKQAGTHAKGSTAYVTLEPCSHYGRTPPCALALIDAGISKVVIANVDVNPKVSGRGITLLENAGIKVFSGLMAESGDRLNSAFNTRMRTGRPKVIVKLAASIDGKTALRNGKSQWITSEASRRDVQRERALSCAIMSGSGTVIADNPRLNVRPDELCQEDAEAFLKRQRQPLRVLIDGKNQLHDKLNLMQDGGHNAVYNLAHNVKLTSPSTAQVTQVLEQSGRVDLHDVMADLGVREINRVWVEGGSKLAGALFENHLVDECVLYLAPKFLGGGARELLDTSLLTDLSQSFAAEVLSLRQIGSDIKLTLAVNN